MTQQREISRVITPTVQVEMSPAYDACNKEVGAGLFERMKTHMSQHVERTKGHMFAAASNLLVEKLVALEV